MAASSWESKYLGLRDEHGELKKRCNEQQRVIKQMYTKLQMIDGAMARKAAKESAASGGAAAAIAAQPPKPADAKARREADALIASLRKENQQLKKANLELRERLRALGQTPKRKTPARTNLQASRAGNTHRASISSALDEFEVKGADADVVAKLRKRLLATEERMKALHEQNNALRRRMESSGGDDRENSYRGINAQRQAASGQTVEPAQDRAADRDLLSLQRDLKDKDAHILILKNRYDHLEAKARAAAEIHERTVFAMEESNRTIRDLRRKIQSLQHENEGLGVHQQRADDLAGELASAKEEARRLEERMTALCESPFINDAFESRSRVDKLLALEREDRQQKVQLEHLKETAKTHHAEIIALKSSSEQLAKQRDHLAKENGELKVRLEQLQRGTGILEDKMRLYSGEAGVDTSELERALTLVKRGQESMGQVSFLEGGSASAHGALPEAANKQKLQELQVVHLETCRELEMTDRMLKAQTSINKDLNQEIADLEAKLKGSNNDLLRKLDDYESLCAKRLQRIHALEAQVKQLLRRKDKEAGRREIEPDADAVSIASLPASESDFGPGENMVEVWVMRAKLNDSKIEPGATTFVMLDFYDYETQTSPLLTGLQPAFDFAASYRISVDHFFMRYLSSETLCLELNRTKHADYELLGQCMLSMRPLLEGSGKFKVDEAEIISVRDGSVLGTMQVCVRLALPIQEQFQMYLREVPGERERLEKLQLADKQDHDAVLARAKAQNQLEVTIVSCSGLGKPSGARAPSPFVHFQLLSFPDTFSQIVPGSTDPVFDRRAPFPMLVDLKLLRFLERERLEVNVLDDDDGDEDGESAGAPDGVLGKTAVSLAPLAKGEPVSGTFGLRDTNGRQAGSLTLRIAWRSPLVALEDVVAAHSKEKMFELAEEQIRMLIKQFDSDGSVDWRAFLAINSPDSGKLQRVQGRLRKVLSKVAESGVDISKAFVHFDKNGDGFISPAELRLALEEINFDLQEEDIDVLVDFLDRDNDGRISYREFAAFASPPPQPVRLVERKLRQAFAEIAENGRDVEAPFLRRQKAGLLSVRDFCKALRALGFELVDRELPRGDPRNEPDFDEEEEEEEGEGEGGAATTAADIPGKRKAAAADADEEEVLEDVNVPSASEFEQLFAQKKLEFQERIARAASASAQVDDPMQHGAEYESLIRHYGPEAPKSATRVQTHFRGFATRLRAQDGAADRATANAEAALVEAEDALRLALHRADSGPKRLDLRAALAKQDADRSGLISVGKFMRALTDCQLGLVSAHAAALAGHFVAQDDTASERRRVDYNEFVKFARFQPRDVSGLSFHVRNALLQVRDDTAFRKFDAEKRGVISRRDFIKALRTVPALKSLGSYDTAALADVFDADSNGEVEYRAFVDFATGQPLALALAKLEEKLRALLRRAIAEGVDLESAFSHFDKNGDGAVSQSEFRQALRELKFDLTAKELQALYARLDPARHGTIAYRSFVRFATAEPDASAAAGGTAAAPDLMATQKRLQNIVRNALSAGMTVHGAFEHYDWTRSGRVSPDMFRKACALLGLPLTMSELDDLSRTFAADDGTVRYRDFVEWCSPKRANSRDVIEKLRLLASSATERDLASTFQHFDLANRGEVSRREFGEGLRELGLELTREELLALMAQFDRDGDGFVQYHEFASTLLGTSRARRGGAKSPRQGKSSPVAAMGDTALHANEGLLKCREALEACDTDFRGLVSVEDFERCVQELGQDVAAEPYLVPGGDGNLVQYRKFLKEQKGHQQFIDSVVRKLSEMVKTRAEAEGGDYMAPFDHFRCAEGASKGFITDASFKRGLEALQFDLDKGEVHAVLERFDLNGDGKVSYREFVDTVSNVNFESVSSSATAAAVTSPGGGAGPHALGAQHRLLMQRLLCVARRRGVPLRSILESRDRSTNGTITVQEAVSVLREVDPDVPQDALISLCSALDAQSDGRLEYGELLHADGKARRSRWAFEEQIRRMVREQRRANGTDLRVLFTHFDRKRKGRFELKAWQRAVEDLAVEVAEADLVEAFNAMNLSGSGRVTFNEFAVFIDLPEYAHEVERKLRKLVLSLVVLGSWELDEGKIKRAFRDALDGADDKVDRHSLKSALRKLGLELPREDLVSIITRYDASGSGRCGYSELALFLDLCGTQARQALTICGRIRQLLGTKLKREPAFSIREHFAERPPGGVLDKGAFLRRLAAAELGLDDRDAHRVADSFAFGGPDAPVDVDEFLDFLLSTAGAFGGASASSPSMGPARERDRSPHSPRRHHHSSGRGGGDEHLDRDDVSEGMIDDITRALQKLLKKAKNRGTDYRKSFEHFDKNYSGEISLEEFEQGLGQLGFTTSGKQAKKLFQRFAGGKKGTIKYRHFLRSLVPSDEVYVEETAEKLRKLLRERVEFNGGGKAGAKTTFRHFEHDSRGEVSRSAFREGLAALDFDLSDSEVRMLLDKFDLDNNGRISLAEFRAFCEGVDASAGKKDRVRHLKRVDQEADEIADELRALVRKAHNQGVDYRQSFEHFDPHYSGRIDSGDFKKGLQRLGFDVQAEHARALLARFAGRDGRIRYRDFLRAVAPEEEATAEETADKFRRMLARVGNLRKAFKHFERNRDGRITRKAFRRGMLALNFDLSDSELRVLMDIFDEDGDGEISFDEFVDFSSRAPGSGPARKHKSKRKGGDNSGSDSESGGSSDSGPDDSRESVGVHLHKLKLSKQSSSLQRVYVQFKLPEEDYVRTQAVAVTDPRKKQTVKLDFDKVLPVAAGSRARKHLKAALRANKCKLQVQALGVKSSGRTKLLGQASIDLRDLLDDMQDLLDEDVSLFDEEDQLVAKLNLSVKALDALQLL